MDQARAPRQLTLLDVLRHLDVDALDRIFQVCDDSWDDRPSPFRGARLSCRALRDIVDSSIAHIRLRMSPGLLASWRPGQRSLLPRFGRCTELSVFFEADSDEAFEQPAPLLAALCVSGMEPAAAAGIVTLSLYAEQQHLSTLAGHAIALAGWLRNVCELRLESMVPCEESPDDNLVVYSALRSALPRLETLFFPHVAFLPGLEAFVGSRLSSVIVEEDAMGCRLHMQDVRSLQQLTHISHLELCLSGGDIGGPAEREPEPASAEEAAAAAAWPGCEDDEATLAGMDKDDAEQLRSLRWLLAAPPAGLRRLEMRQFWIDSDLRDNSADENAYADAEGIVISFAEGGRLTAVDLGSVDGLDGMNYLAAALLPRLLLAPPAPGSQRLPLLQIKEISDTAARFRSFLQPQRPLARLLALCDRVEVGRVEVRGKPPAADTAAVVCAAAKFFHWPHYMAFNLNNDRTIKIGQISIAPPGSRGSGRRSGDGGSSQTAGGAQLAAPGPCPPALADVTAHQLLQRAGNLMWSAAAGTATATSAASSVCEGHEGCKGMPLGVGAMGAVGAAAARLASCPRQSRCADLLLRGPLLRQLAVGPGGARQLVAWLDAWVEEATSAAASLDGQHVGAAAGSTGPGGGAAGAACSAAAEVARGTCITSCEVAAAAATAWVRCRDPPRLCAAVNAAGAVHPGSLEALLLLRPSGRYQWSTHLAMVRS